MSATIADEMRPSVDEAWEEDCLRFMDKPKEIFLESVPTLLAQ